MRSMNLKQYASQRQSNVILLSMFFTYRIIEMYLPISKFFASPPSPPQKINEQSDNRHDDGSNDESSEATVIRTSTATTNSAIVSDDATHSMHNSSNSNANDIN